jgi:hypothetical protein
MSFDFHALCDLKFDDFDDAMEVVQQYTADILDLFHNSEAGKKYVEKYPGKSSWIEPLLHYTFSYDLPALPHMSAWDIRHLLTKIFPEKVSVSQDEAPEIIPEMIAFWQFIDSEFEQPETKQILKYLRETENKYPEIIMDQSKFGIAKTVVMDMLEEGVDLLDEKAVTAFIKRYNRNLPQQNKPLAEERPTKSLAEKQNEYTSPVVELLTLGRPEKLKDWPDYLELGFTKEHVDELSRMAVDWELHEDESDDELYWAPVYAWRILGQLKAEEALDSLLLLVGVMDEYDSDWIGEELPEVFGMIGPSAIPHLKKFLKEGGDKLWGRVLAVDSLKVIGNKYYQARVICINTLLEQLKEFYYNQDTLNAFLISSLIDLKGTEALPVIKEAYEADMVDPMVCGDWEDVQVEFGILKNRVTPPLYGFSDFFEPPPETAQNTDKKKAKAKSKQKQQSKKQNRKKKKKGKRKK